ncbi:MAG: hypothetical protein IPG42_08625 [Betaproteobacteria bacterium]|nr:hypothetical protein [Betaproteobacteria bacterium]
MADTGPLFAQSDNAITIVVPYAPGGTTDMLGRMLAREMAPLLGRRIIVDNKPGAGSGLGASAVARAPADGNTLLIATSSTLAINPWLYKKLAMTHSMTSAPVGMIGAVPLCVIVNAAKPINSIDELIIMSKAKPGGLNYGSAGNGSPQHLVVELFKVASVASSRTSPTKAAAGRPICWAVKLTSCSATFHRFAAIDRAVCAHWPVTSTRRQPTTAGHPYHCRIWRARHEQLQRHRLAGFGPGHAPVETLKIRRCTCQGRGPA